MNCKYCGEPLGHPRAKQVYCSHSCRQMAYISRKISQNKAITDTLLDTEALDPFKVQELLDQAHYLADKVNFLQRENGGNSTANEVLKIRMKNLKKEPSIDTQLLT